MLVQNPEHEQVVHIAREKGVVSLLGAVEGVAEKSSSLFKHIAVNYV